MIIWRITGNEIGPDGNSAAHFATKAEADKALTDYRAWCRENGRQCFASSPAKLTISNREQLAVALNQAMGFGAT